jgi:hypothetical protein
VSGMCGEADLDPAERDDRLQMAVLGHLLLAYPAPLTLEEIVTAFEEPFRRSFEETDGIRRAVRDLVCGGLLQEWDGSVLPTRATFRFSQLVGL